MQPTNPIESIKGAVARAAALQATMREAARAAAQRDADERAARPQGSGAFGGGNDPVNR